MARDFENDRVTKSTGWWDWRPSKVALERLHFDGRLITSRRRDFQKVYDLPGNVLPSDIDQTPPSPQAFARHVIVGSLRAWGIGHAKDIGYRGRYVKNNVIKAELKKMVDEGDVCQVEIMGLKSPPLFMLAEYQKRKILPSNEVFILSPFDVFNVLRHRLSTYFNFDYQVECFVPEKKRKYGYFSLPILFGDTFIARMDAKSERKQSVLIVNNLHFEKPGLSRAVLKKLSTAIREYARFNACDQVLFIRSNDNKSIQVLTGFLIDIIYPVDGKKRRI